ncbi:MAG: MGMT family protein [Luteibaculaceae bacterium]
MEQNEFIDAVYAVVRLIPQGRVTTYGAIAAAIGAKKSSRMVGWALNKSLQTGEFLPAHRVVNRNGLLTGKNYFGSADTMQKLLESEGVLVVDDKVLHFKKHFWDPISEL